MTEQVGSYCINHAVYAATTNDLKTHIASLPIASHYVVMASKVVGALA